MDSLIKTVTKIVFPFILLLGVYIALHGHLSPGGAFPAGVIIATGFALLIVSYTERDVEHKITRHELIDFKTIAGIILIVLIISMGHKSRMDLLNTQTFLELWSGGFTPFLNITGMFMIITAIIVILYTMIRE